MIGLQIPILITILVDWEVFIEEISESGMITSKAKMSGVPLRWEGYRGSSWINRLCCCFEDAFG